MCPLCLAASGLYVAGGLSPGAVAAKLPRKRPQPTASTTSTDAEGDHHATTDDRIEK